MPRPRPDDADEPDAPAAPDAGLSERGRATLTRSLQDVASRTQAQLGVADGVGVTVLLGAGLVFAGANAFTEVIDQTQYALMEGPCVEAAAFGAVVRSGSIGADETRWPTFTPRAAALDLRGVVSAPLVASCAVVGSLNLYSRSRDSLDALDLDGVRRAADDAERASSSARLMAAADANAHWLGTAITNRVDVDLAVGFVMDRYAMTQAQARAFVSVLAHQDGVSEAAAARSIVADARS